MPESPDQDTLTRLLRAGDPAAGEPGLDRSERVRMRRAILAAGRQRRPTAGWLLPAAAAIAILAMALGLALRRPLAPLGTAALERSGREVAGGETGVHAASGAQVQFTTDGGTLVVWVLQPRPLG